MAPIFPNFHQFGIGVLFEITRELFVAEEAIRPDGVAGEFRFYVDILQEFFPHIYPILLNLRKTVFVVDSVVKDSADIEILVLFFRE